MKTTVRKVRVRVAPRAITRKIINMIFLVEVMGVKREGQRIREKSGEIAGRTEIDGYQKIKKDGDASPDRERL